MACRTGCPGVGSLRSKFGSGSLLSLLLFVSTIQWKSLSWFSVPSQTSIESNHLPVVEEEAALSQVCFDVVVVPLLLPSLGALPFLQLAIEHLFHEEVVCYVYDVASPS